MIGYVLYINLNNREIQQQKCNYHKPKPNESRFDSHPCFSDWWLSNILPDDLLRLMDTVSEKVQFSRIDSHEFESVEDEFIALIDWQHLFQFISLLHTVKYHNCSAIVRIHTFF